MSVLMTLSWPEPEIALLTFDLPGRSVNLLSRAFVSELKSCLEKVSANPKTVGLVLISAKPGNFSAGADLAEMEDGLLRSAAEVAASSLATQGLFARLSSLPFPTVAALSGTCLGGGAELACWCDGRLAASDDVAFEIGFPEVKLGLLPGWGGTVCLPRLVGLPHAVRMICLGESVSLGAAKGMGLIDEVVPAGKLLDQAVAWVRNENASGSYLRRRTKRKQPLKFDLVESDYLQFTTTAAIASQWKGPTEAPLAALSHLLETANLTVAEAAPLDAAAIARMYGSSLHRAELNAFLLTERNRSGSRAKENQGALPIDSVSQLAVVGAGIMGIGIAAASLKHGVKVQLADASPANLQSASIATLAEAAYEKRLGKASPARQSQLSPSLSLAQSLADLSAANLVVEAIVENLDAKRQLYAELEPLLSPTAILASNTSTIPVTKLAAGLARPEQFVGMHFFNPVRRMKVVEIVKGAATSEQTIQRAVAFAQQIGKMPIVVQDGPGFLVNRVLFPYMNEAVQLLCEGASVAEVDAASVAFGMPLGPLALYDLVGLDTSIYAGMVMYLAFPDRAVASPLAPALLKQGRLGRKSGRGFYSYENKQATAEVDPAIDKTVDVYRRGEKKFSSEEIFRRLFFPMLLEAVRALEEKVVGNPRDVDLGLIYGLGFPAYRGGLLYWADEVGLPQIIEQLRPLEGLGRRYQPPALLLELAKSGRRFYDL